MKEIILDKFNLGILDELMRDSRQTVQQIAQSVGLSTSPCWKRIKEMEAAGVIRGYTAVVEPQMVGLGLCVIVEANMAAHTEENVRKLEKAIAACPQIVRCVSTTGESDYVMTVLVADRATLRRLKHCSRAWWGLIPTI